MDPAFWAWTDRSSTPNIDRDLAQYLRNEFPNDSSLTALTRETRGSGRGDNSDGPAEPAPRVPRGLFFRWILRRIAPEP
jgi:hypothetical protein